MLELRPYQEKLISDIRNEFMSGKRRVLAVSPTGSGKTATTAAMIKRTIERGGTAMFTVHRQELLDQSMGAFMEQGIEFGVVAAGKSYESGRSVILASIDTLRGRIRNGSFHDTPSIIVIDEAAHSCSRTWQSTIEAFPKSRIIGITATPERLDGKGLGDIYDSMVLGPTTEELIRAGFLSPYELYAPSSPDISSVGTRMGDYASDQIAGIMDEPSITGSAISEYKRHCDGSRAVAFCVSIEHSNHTAESFEAAGIASKHVDGAMSKNERRKIIEAFRSGEIKVLSSVDILGEGFDLPAVEAAILLRPTQSLALYLQQIGRAMRISEGKKRAVILDHAGNILRHGFPDDDRVWSLDARRRTKKSSSDSVISIRECPKCKGAHRTKPACPYCGHIYEVQAREVAHVEGDLQQIVKGQFKKPEKGVPRKTDTALHSARSHSELESLGIERGYKNPAVWAEIILASRQNRKPNFGKVMSIMKQRRA